MQPKIPRRLSKSNIWSHNTSYVGISGKHSENSPGAIARNTNIDNRLNKFVSALKEMERKQFQNLEKSKREIQNSMLAYTDRVRQINADKYLKIYTDTTDTSPKSTSRGSSNGTRRSTSPTDRSYRSSFDSEKKESIILMKNRRVSLPKLSNNRKLNRTRRLSSVSDSIVTVKQKPIASFDHFSESISRNTRDDTHTNEDLSFGDIRISPFPYESYDFSPSQSSTNSAYSPTQHRRRVSYRQYREEKELERERIQNKRRSEIEDDPLVRHRKAALRQAAETKRAALLLEKARQEALKNKKDICNNFCYSFAMEELLKKSDPLRFKASEKDYVSKVEIDKDGTIKQTLGPAVLTIIGVDELDNYQGMRIKWSAKYRQNDSVRCEETKEDSFLPEITVTEDRPNISRQITREQSDDNLDNMCPDGKSSISAVSVDG